MVRSFRTTLLAGAAVALTPAIALAACPPATTADMMELEPARPQQFELAEFESQAGCTVAFSENPEIAVLNARILGNPDLPPVAERLPVEPLVVAPYQAIGPYGGVITGMSNAAEAGSSDVLSRRHVNLVRFSDDLRTIVPSISELCHDDAPERRSA